MIVGLTGGIGSGKSTVCALFKHLGVPIISADEIAHHLIDTDKKIFLAIVQKFGHEYLDAGQKLDRHKLRQLIFTNPADKLWLETLLHPLIAKEIVNQAQEVTYPYCIVEIPLLIEAGMQDIVDRILTVDCPVEVQLARAIQRDQYPEAEIRAIIANQITREKRLASTNDVLETNVAMPELIKRVEKLHHVYLSLAS
ncbi:MAG TPA: dephospho-CoA kinase [Gammaproteobacteria bacterium]|nr:dephospho-CoA kinase [Gammaproteobacteria bacterium]